MKPAARLAGRAIAKRGYASCVVRAVWLSLLLIGWLAGGAASAPGDAQQRRAETAAEQRVVLADPDRELRHAIEQSLAPWRLEVVVDPSPIAPAGDAAQRADAGRARFVVWRDGDQLVVYDRQSSSVERRASRAGVLDPLTAAAAALTIKMMMRLPPPPEPPPEPPEPADHGNAPIVAELAAPPPRRFPELRVQAGIATRIARGDRTSVSGRLGGAVAIRPWLASGWRLGLAGDGGTSTSIVRAAFRGTWSEWALVGIASWSHASGAWELEPYAGAGARRSVLSGTEMGEPRRDTATIAIGRLGAALRWRSARWTFGAAVAVDLGLSGTRSFHKTSAAAVIFQVPGAGVELSGLLACDL